MNNYRRLENIIEDHLHALESGTETVESILASYPKDRKALQPQLEAVLWLKTAGQNLAPRLGFIASTRKSLEQRIINLPKQSIWQRLAGRYSSLRWAFNVAAPILLILVLALVVNNAVLYARLSIPGDPLYSTKLVIEDVQLAFTFSIGTKTDLYIRFSRERTTEFVELVLEGDYAQLPAAADRMETDIIAALHSLDDISLHDPAVEMPTITKLRDTLSNEITMLEVLKETSPSSAHPGIDLAIQVAQSGVMALR